MGKRVNDGRLAELILQCSQTPARKGVELDAKTDLLELLGELEEIRELLAWLSGVGGQLSIGPLVNGVRFHWYGEDGTTLHANNLVALLETAHGVSIDG